MDPDFGKAVDNVPLLARLSLTEMDADELLYTSHFVHGGAAVCLQPSLLRQEESIIRFKACQGL